MFWTFKTHHQPFSIPTSSARTSRAWNNLQCGRGTGESSWTDPSWDPPACSLPTFLMTNLKQQLTPWENTGNNQSSLLWCGKFGLRVTSRSPQKASQRWRDTHQRDPRLFTWWKVSLLDLKGHIPLLKGIPGDDHLDNFRNLLLCPQPTPTSAGSSRWSLCQESQSWHRSSLHHSRTADQASPTRNLIIP